MSGPKHRELASGRWRELTLSQQLGNVGSEVGRALRWRTENPRLAQGAMERALELMDLTIADPRHHHPVARLREIARAREVLVDFLAGSNVYGSTAESLQRWFDVYAIAAARHRKGSPP